MEGITTEQLNEILTKHAEWVNSSGAKKDHSLLLKKQAITIITIS